jgi:hypothetical protein
MAVCAGQEGFVPVVGEHAAIVSEAFRTSSGKFCPFRHAHAKPPGQVADAGAKMPFPSRNGAFIPATGLIVPKRPPGVAAFRLLDQYERNHSNAGICQSVPGNLAGTGRLQSQIPVQKN